MRGCSKQRKRSDATVRILPADGLMQLLGPFRKRPLSFLCFVSTLSALTLIPSRSLCRTSANGHGLRSMNLCQADPVYLESLCPETYVEYSGAALVIVVGDTRVSLHSKRSPDAVIARWERTCDRTLRLCVLFFAALQTNRRADSTPFRQEVQFPSLRRVVREV